MTKFALALVGAVALSVGVLVQPSAAEQVGPTHKTRITRVNGAWVCNYQCGPKLHVCPSDDSDPKSGCSLTYRCVTGLPGSNDCP